MLANPLMWLLTQMLPWYHWPELEAPLRPRRRTGQRAHHTLHQQQLVSEQRVQSGPSACPGLSLVPAAPFVLWLVSVLVPLPRPQTSPVSSQQPQTWHLSRSYEYRAMIQVTWPAIWRVRRWLSASVYLYLKARQVFGKLKIAQSNIRIRASCFVEKKTMTSQ